MVLVLIVAAAIRGIPRHYSAALLACFFLVAGCNQGTPYAFRLMIPPSTVSLKESLASLLPFWFWEEVDRFETWQNCESRQIMVSIANWPEKAHLKLARRSRAAQCVPLH